MRNTGKLVLAAMLMLMSMVSFAAAQRYMAVKVGELRVLDLKDIVRVAVASPEYFSYKILENGQLLIIGEKEGETSFHVWLKDDRELSYAVEVKSDATSEALALAQQLARKVPGLEVTEIRGVMTLSGIIDLAKTKHLDEFTKVFPNALNFVTVREFNYGKLVRLDAQIIEVKSSDVEQLGVRWDTSMSGPTIGIAKKWQSNPYFAVYRGEDKASQDILGAVPIQDESFYDYIGISSAIGSKIDLLLEDGKARVLSAPKLVTKTGEPANFHVGGTIPYQVIGPDGVTGVEKEAYGVTLDVTPVVDDQNRIQVTFKAEVSAIDPGTVVGGNPGTLVRSVNSTINLYNNQVMVVSGLAQQSKLKSTSKVPLLGDIPVLGKLFSSKQKNFQETEVLVFIRPQIVDADSETNKQLMDVSREFKSGFGDIDLNKALME